MKTPKTSTKRIALVAGLILGSSAWLNAQTSQYQSEQSDAGSERASEMKKADQSGQPAKINKGSALIGTTVKNQQGENLGKIREIVIDFNSDRVAYVVLASDAGALSSEKLHAIPLRAFKPDPAGTTLVLNADKAKLENAPGFDKNNWPALGTTTLGAEPFWKETQETPRQRLDIDQSRSKEDQNKATRPTP